MSKFKLSILIGIMGLYVIILCVFTIGFNLILNAKLEPDEAGALRFIPPIIGGIMGWYARRVWNFFDRKISL